MINISTLIGFVHLIIALIYLRKSVTKLMLVIRNSGTFTEITSQILQVLILPIILFLSGGILLVQGWRLYPLFVFQQLLITGLLIYLMIRNGLSQIVITSIVLSLSGLILLSQGWLLDPLLRFQQLLMIGLLIYLMIRSELFQN